MYELNDARTFKKIYKNQNLFERVNKNVSPWCNPQGGRYCISARVQKSYRKSPCLTWSYLHHQKPLGVCWVFESICCWETPSVCSSNQIFDRLVLRNDIPVSKSTTNKNTLSLYSSVGLRIVEYHWRYLTESCYIVSHWVFALNRTL